jgi:hypothetical protein
MTPTSRACQLLTAMVLAVAVFFTAVQPLLAADPTFPMASVIGLVPPNGMVASKTFPGFEDPDKDAAILLAAQSPAVYEDLKTGIDPDVLKKGGITVQKREDIPLSFGTATLVTGKALTDNKTYRKWLMIGQAKNVTALVNAQVPENEKAYSDEAMRAALLTLAVRETVPDAEKLSVLPFAIGDLAGFHVQNVLVGRAALIGDPPDATNPKDFQAHLFIGVFPGGPKEPDDRAEFARIAFSQILGIENVKISISEPLRMNNQAGYQTVAQAVDAHTGTNIMVAQWLRFGGGAFMQMIAMAPADKWVDAQTRLRTVRDSIDLK